jgi:hypothetical protein
MPKRIAVAGDQYPVFHAFEQKKLNGLLQGFGR